jgi:hypothetical protein
MQLFQIQSDDLMRSRKLSVVIYMLSKTFSQKFHIFHLRIRLLKNIVRVVTNFLSLTSDHSYQTFKSRNRRFNATGNWLLLRNGIEQSVQCTPAIF